MSVGLLLGDCRDDDILKLTFNLNLIKFRLFVTPFSFVESIWNFAQSATISLPCCTQHFGMIQQLRNKCDMNPLTDAVLLILHIFIRRFWIRTQVTVKCGLGIDKSIHLIPMFIAKYLSNIQEHNHLHLPIWNGLKWAKYFSLYRLIIWVFFVLSVYLRIVGFYLVGVL